MLTGMDSNTRGQMTHGFGFFLPNGAHIIVHSERVLRALLAGMFPGRAPRLVISNPRVPKLGRRA